MLLRALGGLNLDGASFSRRKPLVLLCHLALEGPLDRRRVATLFWPSATDPSNRLSVTLSRLRNAVPGSIDAEGETLASPLATDVHALREALEAGRTDEALRLYTGPFLLDVPTGGAGPELEEWIVETREDLARRVRALAVRAAEQHAAGGRFDEAATLADAARQVAGAPAADPALLGRLHTLLVAGDGAGAEVVAREAAEFDLDLAVGRAHARASLRAVAAPARLPRPVTSFVGRDDERAELGSIVGSDDRPLVTLLGTGGIGKTRLALALAHDLHAAGAFDGGVHFVSLATVPDRDGIVDAIATALGAEACAGESTWEALLRRLGHLRTVLVLDDFEHLVGDATVISDLLAAAPGLFVLATSRLRLELEEESTFTVQGLSVPPTSGEDAPIGEAAIGTDATRLFVERARRSRLDFQPSAADAAAIATICRLVQGAPLAIELAAVWVRRFSPAEIAHNLRATLDDLGSPSRNIPARHRTMRASFAHTWAQLERDEREALRRVAAFAGGFDADAAQAVAEVDAAMLERLLGHALLTRDDAGHYGLHPLTADYASEALAEDAAARARLAARHAAHYRDLATRLSGAFYGPDQAEATARFDREAANLARADAWAVEHDGELALDLVAHRWTYWRFSGRFAAGRAQALRALDAAPDAAEGSRARARHVAGAMAYRLGAFAEARTDLTRAVELAERAHDEETLGNALQTLGNVAVSTRHLGEAKALFEQALTIADRRDDPVAERSAQTGLGEVAGVRLELDAAHAHFERALASAERDGAPTSIATCHFNLGAVARDRGDLAAAEHHFALALKGDERVGDRWGIALCVHELGSLAYARGRRGRAQHLWSEALAMYLDMDDAAHAANAHHDLGLVAKLEGRLDDARSHYREALATWLRLDEPVRAASVLWGLASLATAEGASEHAARLWGAEAALLRDAELVRSEAVVRAHDDDVAATRARIHAATFDRAWHEGATWSLADVLRAEDARAAAGREAGRTKQGAA